MDISDIVMILAVILGPILAVQTQKYIELIQETEKRKLHIFRTLMSTRATKLSQDHVTALNMIDIEFYGKKYFGKRFQSKNEKKIIQLWQVYNNYLNTGSVYIDSGDAEAVNHCTALLAAIAQHLGYKFDDVQLNSGCYRPIAHAQIEGIQHQLLQGLVEVLQGEKSIPMTLEGLSKNKNKTPSNLS